MAAAHDTSIMLDKDKVLSACIDIQEEILAEQRVKLDKIVRFWQSEERCFFGLLQRKPATDRQATLDWVEKHEPLVFSLADRYRRRELEIVQSIGHLVLASEPTVTEVSVSAMDFTWLQEAYGKDVIVGRTRTVELMQHIARGLVPPRNREVTEVLPADIMQWIGTGIGRGDSHV